MKSNVQITQLEGEIISHDNTIKSINDRIQWKSEAIAAIKKPGRPDKFTLEYGDRIVEIAIEEPDKYAKALEELTIKLLSADIDSLKAAIEKQLIEKKNTEKQLADLKAKE